LPKARHKFINDALKDIKEKGARAVHETITRKAQALRAAQPGRAAGRADASAVHPPELEDMVDRLAYRQWRRHNHYLPKVRPVLDRLAAAGRLLAPPA